MSFIFLIIVLMFVMDLLWWRWARGVLRCRGIRPGWQRALDAFMFIQVICLVWIIVGRSLGMRSERFLPGILLSEVFLWHFILLPIATLSGLVYGLFSIRHKKTMEVAPATGPTRREVLGALFAAAPPVASVLVTGASQIQLNQFRLRRFDLPISGLPSALDGLTIAQVSDVHVGRFTNGRILRQIVEQTNRLKADLVLMTGDLINSSLSDLPAALDMVQKLDAKNGIYLCEGNHDLFEGRTLFEVSVKDRGVPLLINESTMLNIRGYPVQLLGLRWGPGRDDVGINQSMSPLVQKLQPGAFPILMAHHPHAFDAAADAGIPLTLSGHTHGGQLMASPAFGFGPLMYRYWSGLYEKSQSKLIVSNGVGNWFPLRINAPAEIVHITLHRA